MDKLIKKIGICKEITNPFKKSLYILGIITEALSPHGIQPILVGGGAVEFYTLGGYTTKDLDLVVEGRDKAKEILDKLEFKRRPGARHWYREDLDVAIEMPDDFLAGSKEKVVKVQVEDMQVFIIGIEDLLIDRLSAYKFWKSTSDGEWAERMILIYQKEIDWNYFEDRASLENLKDVLSEIVDRVAELHSEL